MGRQIMANLHRGFSKDREGKRGKEQEQRSEQQVSEDRWGDRVQRTYTGIDIGKTFLKTEGGQGAEILHRDLSKEREGKRAKEEEQRSV